MGIELLIHGLKTDSCPVIRVVGVLAVVTSMTFGFVVGLILVYLLFQNYPRQGMPQWPGEKPSGTSTKGRQIKRKIFLGPPMRQWG
jgi:hypothetical protein